MNSYGFSAALLILVVFLVFCYTGGGAGQTPARKATPSTTSSS